MSEIEEQKQPESEQKKLKTSESLDEVEIVWKKHILEQGIWKYWGIGPLRLWCQCNYNELRVCFDRKREQETPENSSTPPDDLAWSRWLLEDKPTEILLKPVFPDRPMIIKPENLIRVAKGTKTKFYVRIPLWIRMESTLKSNHPLLEIPIAVLSKTYFGTYMKGELCYWISSGVRPEIQADNTRNFLAICPLQIINKSDEELQINKLCLRVSELSIYLDQGQLWASKTKITYRGSDSISQIEVSKKQPIEVEKGTLISSPRSKEQRKGFAAKTFATLKDIPGLGFLIKYGE